MQDEGVYLAAEREDSRTQSPNAHLECEDRVNQLHRTLSTAGDDTPGASVG